MAQPSLPPGPIPGKEPVNGQCGAARTNDQIENREIDHGIHAEKGGGRAMDIAQDAGPGQNPGHPGAKPDREIECRSQDDAVYDPHPQRIGHVIPDRPEVMSLVQRLARISAPAGLVLLLLGRFRLDCLNLVPIQRWANKGGLRAQLGHGLGIEPGMGAEEILQIKAVHEINVENNKACAESHEAQHGRIRRSEPKPIPCPYRLSAEANTWLRYRSSYGHVSSP